MRKIGLVVAMEEEMSEIYSKLGKFVAMEDKGALKVSIFENDGVTLYLIGSGIGEIAAAVATTILISEYCVEAIINFGVVGSLNKKYRAKDVVFVNEVVHYDFTFSASDEAQYGKYAFNRNSFVNIIDEEVVGLAQTALGDIPKVRLATADKFVDSAKLKKVLVEKFHADICDMESMGLYIACRNWGIPLFMIKAVSDDADESAQISFEEIITGGVNFYIAAVRNLIEILKTV